MSKTSGDPLLFGKRIINRLGRPFGVNPFPRAFDNPIALEQATRDGVFEQVFTANFWGSSESRSGVGSERAFTLRYATSLKALILERRISSLFDAPCGDLNWMSDVIEKTGIAYQGGDISSSVIAQVRKHHPRLDVRVFDVCKDVLPEAELWHCRDCLFHLPLADIRLAFQNFARSNIPSILITTHKARWLHRNLDVSLGGFRFIDLERAPFNMPRAEVYLPDYKPYTDFPRYMALWSRTAVQEALRQRTKGP